MSIRPIALLTLAALALAGYSTFHKARQRRAADRSKAPPGPIQTWEGEGGGLPDGGPGPGVGVSAASGAAE